MSVFADFDAPARSIYWWASDGTTWTTPFESLPVATAGPCGMRLPGRSERTRGAVMWLLKRAEVAPL